MKTWRLIKTIETKGAMQMAIDEAILIHRIKNKVPNTLRFFTWKPKCLTIGYFQDINKEVNIEHAKKLNVDIVRRYTGGGAVFHDEELTYSLAISETDASRDIIESYKKICNAIINGLDAIGIQSEFKPINDITVNNKKISGNAQTRKQGIVLQHGTILIDVNVKKMFSLLKVPNEKIKDKMIKTVEERITCLKQELNKQITLDDLKCAITQSFEKTFNIKLIESKLTQEELNLAKKLYKEKYSTKQWTELR